METAKHVQAVQMIKDGYTAQQIAEALNYKSIDSIYEKARRHGLKVKKAHADRDADILAMRKRGVSVSLIAERLNVDINIVGAVCRKSGLGLNTIKLTEQKPKPKHKHNQWTDRDKDEVGRQAVEKYAPDYEYIGGYTGSDGTLVIRHKACGYTFRTSAITLRHKPAGCYLCDQIEKQKQQEKEKEAQARLIEVTRFIRPVPKYKPIQLKTCAVCGTFYYSNRTRARFCSKECSNEAAKKYANGKKEIRRKKAQTKDSAGITARRLYMKYGGICWLCGKPCDITASPNSDLYPSVDHVKPISKGGVDSWDNVRLAHRICNSVRSNHEEITKICN